MDYEQRLRDLGIELPDYSRIPYYGMSYGSMKPHHRVGNLLFLSGHIPEYPDGRILNQNGRLGKDLTIEQGYEADVPVTQPQDNGAGIDLTYANMSFGQAVQITAIQMAAADSSILNGGTYYQPHLVDQIITSNGQATTVQPKILEKNVVSPKVGQEMIPLMQYVVQQHLVEGFPYLNFPANYSVGGKTGTAQVAQPGGGYYADKFDGTYVGFVGGDKPQYVIVVYNILPGVAGYAGSNGGQPVFADLAHMLIDNSYVTPKTSP